MFSWGKRSLLLLFPLFMSIFSCFRMYIEISFLFPTLILDTQLKPTKQGYIVFALIKALLIMISNFMFGIPTLIIWAFDRKKSKIDRIKINWLIGKEIKIYVLENQTLKNNNSIETYLVIFGITVLLSFFLPSINFLNLLNKKASQIGYSMYIILIIINSYVTHKVFNYSWYRHHFLSIGLCFFGIVLVQIPEYLDFYDTKSIAYIYLGFVAIQFLLSCLDVTEKWLMEKKFISFWKLLFCMGSFGLCIYAIAFLVLAYIDCPADWKGHYCDEDMPIVDLITLFNKMPPSDYIWAFVLIICGSLYLLFFLMTLFYFTPTHRCIADIFSSFVFWIPTFNGGYGVITLIGYLISILGSLIYNELIILNFWKFDRNTKAEIYKRSMSEFGHNNLELGIAEEDLNN